MRVSRDINEIRLSGVVLTIGNFDGVHRGHQAILAAGRRRADQVRTQLVVMTFEPHPLAILTPDHIPAALTPLDEKLQCLEEAGADLTVVIESNREFLGISADQFVEEIIMGRFAPVAMVEGASFSYGRRREGDVQRLARDAERFGFTLEVIDPVRVELGGHTGTVVSSSLIRQLIASGNMDQVRQCLGRPYALFGRVVTGARRGRDLGFPTANLVAPGQVVPGEGVYAGRTAIGDQYYPAAISVGRSPTFGGDSLTIEAHLLDFTGDLYQSQLRLEFLDWIRAQRKFPSPDELVRQIQQDIRRMREVFRRFGG